MRRDKLIKEYTTRGGTHVTIFQEMPRLNTEKEEAPFPDHVEDDMQVHIANKDADEERKVLYTEDKKRPDLVEQDKRILALLEGIKTNREMIVKNAKIGNEGFEQFRLKHNIVANILTILLVIQACPWVWPYLIMLKDVVKSYM